MSKAVILLAYLVTPFVAGFWALVCFYQGWVGGWEIATDEWRKS